VIGSVRAALEKDGGENLVLSRAQLSDLLAIAQGQGYTAPESAYPALAAHQGARKEATFKEIAKRAVADNSPQPALSEIGELLATPVGIAIDFFGALAKEKRHTFSINENFAGPLSELVNLNAAIHVIAWVGFAAFEDYRVEGKAVQNVIRTVDGFLDQQRIPKVADAGRNKGAVVGSSFVNRRAGAPGWEPKFRVQDTGGKDYFCRSFRAPVLCDDHAGACFSAAYCGVTPVLVKTEARQHRKAGVVSHAGFMPAARHVVRLLASADSRRRLLSDADRIRMPHRNARQRSEFGDAEDAPADIRAEDLVRVRRGGSTKKGSE